MKTSRLLTAFATAALLLGCAPGGQKAEGPYYIDIKDRAQLHEWFRYSPERPVVISGHRGGMVTGFPENCIESFEKTLTMMPSFFEIDPRMTKDSVIVLMHDATIDRTTTGTGKVSDYTYAELQQFFLKDREGNVTTYKIPTLEECIAWSQGKTILNLDIKDVPLEVMSQFINRLAPANVMYTVRNAKQARTYLDRDPQAMFSCWCKNMKEFNEYVGERIPWSQVMAYVGTMMLPDQQELYDNLHRNGVMCMISLAPTHDRRATDAQKIQGYELEIPTGCDVIETDYPYLFQNLDLNTSKQMAAFEKYRSVYTHDELMERLRRIRHVALDMDGTIYMGMSLFPYTKPFLAGLKEMGIGYSFLTNNPSKSIADYLHKLDVLGIHATREEMYTTALATIDYIREHYPAAKRLFLLGTPSMISEFEAAGFESAADSADDVPDVVVAAFDMTLQYDRLCRAAWWVSQGVPYIATNPDRVCPTDQPTVLVDCGSICACIEHATGRRPDITLGKPDPNMLSGILSRHGLQPDQIAMVGDRIYTDVAMAHNAKAMGVLVLSGETTLDVADKADPQPHITADSIEVLGALIREAHSK